MNSEVKKFVLADPEKTKYYLALSLKVTQNEIINDENVVIYCVSTLEKILNLIHLINYKIDTWIIENFHHKKYIFISFDENRRKLWFDNRFTNQTIEWKIGFEDDFKISFLSIKRANISKYIIPNSLYNYIDSFFSTDDNQFYLKLQKSTSREISKNIMLMFCHFQREISDTVLFEDNCDKLHNWLMRCQNRHCHFKWIKISKNSFTIHSC
jgi:hypothetical protein